MMKIIIKRINSVWYGGHRPYRTRQEALRAVWQERAA